LAMPVPRKRTSRNASG